MPKLTTQTSESTPFDSVAGYCQAMGNRVRCGARQMASVAGSLRDRWLLASAEAIRRAESEILVANQDDLRRAEEAGLNAAQIDRLRLDASRIGSMAESLCNVAALPDPIGEVLDGHVRPNGMEVTRIRVPIGVVFMIYESRPNVTVDAAAICIKSGNGVILRGGKEALRTNEALFNVLHETATKLGLPTDALQWVDRTEHEVVTQFLGMPEAIDVVIPRGGAALVKLVTAQARMPVIKHESGNCHVFVDRAAEATMAERIVLDAKCQRPGVCNACESLLIHRDWEEASTSRLVGALIDAGVEVRGDQRIQTSDDRVLPIGPDDDDQEYLDLVISARVVDSLEQAVDHIAKHSSGHTETIITGDYAAARQFTQVVDSATVLVNASTRLNDGAELGLGAEIGISTDRIHARGPCGIKELTTYKYVCWGNGQTKGLRPT